MTPATSGQPGIPRRTPRQERSRLMVERIVDAGRQVLIEHGYEGASTNRIAEAAGISPGSLYQYFPNKDVIIAAVVDEYADRITAAVTHELMEQVGRASDLHAVRRTLAVLLDTMSEQPELLRAMIEHTPRLGLGSKIADFERRVGELAVMDLRVRSSTSKHANARIWIAIRTVENLTIRYVLEEPAIDRDEFLDELVDLVAGYFLRGNG
ncbi:MULTISPECIES: TetR/AcrR family transcriptional regulator [unclassified Mycobacteroides]|uniref:TetR/AcrR family transcriptional regulator n=1 Tax=unclassified Mycobacteroides TaxID=2618759 RepID=UPI00193DBFAB|nr:MULTISPECIES: TetR/AcrR family transcriptional regulator [unclassified Mycobacteroides]